VEKINAISEELEQLESMLGKFPAVNPYKVPAGYFDEFPAIMYAIISEKELTGAVHKTEVPYQVPTGYFDSLAADILAKTKQPESSNESASREIASLSPLLSTLSKKMPFSVPEDYFNNAPGELNAKNMPADPKNVLPDANEEELSELMTSLRSVNVYQVPSGYFGRFPGIILQKVFGSRINEAKVYQLDAGRAQKAMPALTTGEATGDGTIISASTGRAIKGSFGRNAWKYAVAAVFAGVMITAGLFVFNKNAGQTDLAATRLQEKTAQASDAEILNYLENQTMPQTDSSIINTNPNIEADAIPDMLADVSDEELQQYLQLQSDTKLLIN
jgi:hypothetical protein